MPSNFQGSGLAAVNFNIEAIATFRGLATQNFETPRQASLAEDSGSYVELDTKIDPISLKDLESFSHIWLLYVFSKSADWKSLVLPPRGKEKRGVFATRSNYRPNFIGMSCVELKRVDGRKIFIGSSDLLDKTPIIDIKPYLPYSDQVIDASSGWTADISSFTVNFTDEVLAQINHCRDLLKKNSLKDIDFTNILKNQLSYEPTDSNRKRVRALVDDFEFALRTFRFRFSFDEENHLVTIQSMSSGYSKKEMESTEDPYGDKGIHKELFF